MKILTVILALFVSSATLAQSAGTSARCINPKFDKTVNGYLDFTVPVLSVTDLSENLKNYILLDAREMEEYKVSHIPGAIHVGYDTFDISNHTHLDKNKPVLLYCSIGYRSEKVAEKFQKAGFKNVFNLYGSIFEWANRGYTLEDNEGKQTKRIHTYNKKWGKWMENTDYIKVH